MVLREARSADGEVGLPLLLADIVVINGENPCDATTGVLTIGLCTTGVVTTGVVTTGVVTTGVVTTGVVTTGAVTTGAVTTGVVTTGVVTTGVVTTGVVTTGVVTTGVVTTGVVTTGVVTTGVVTTGVVTTGNCGIITIVGRWTNNVFSSTTPNCPADRTPGSKVPEIRSPAKALLQCEWNGSNEHPPSVMVMIEKIVDADLYDQMAQYRIVEPRKTEIQP